MTENMGLSENMYPVDSDGGLSRKYVHAHDSLDCVVLMTAAMPSRTLESMSDERRESAMLMGYKEEDMITMLIYHDATALNEFALCFALSECGFLKHIHVHEPVLVLFLRVNGAYK